LLQASFLRDLIFAFVSVVFQVAHVGDVAYIPYFITEVAEITGYYIEGQKGANVAQVNVIVYGRTADIHADVAGVDGGKKFFFTSQGIR
jgi:hypothetical protein